MRMTGPLKRLARHPSAPQVLEALHMRPSGMSMTHLAVLKKPKRISMRPSSSKWKTCLPMRSRTLWVLALREKAWPAVPEREQEIDPDSTTTASLIVSLETAWSWLQSRLQPSKSKPLVAQPIGIWLITRGQANQSQTGRLWSQRHRRRSCLNRSDLTVRSSDSVKRWSTWSGTVMTTEWSSYA